MILSNNPSGAAWFTSSDPEKPNFFLEASAFRPQITRDFELGIPHTVNVLFEETYKGYPRVSRVYTGIGSTDGVYLYPRHTTGVSLTEN